jgi:type IV pilus assembly protein PilM
VRIPALPSGGRIALPTRRRNSATVALDIGPDAIVVVQFSGTDRARVRRAIVHPLPVGLVVDGEVVNADGLAVQLRRLFDEHKLSRDVRVGLAHPRLMVRMVELPASLTGTDLDGAVRQLVVDYRPVGLAPADLGGQQRILMAAARVDGIDRLMRALDGADLRAQRIQLSGLALLSSLDHPPVGDDAILYVQAGALTNVVITENGEPLLVRAASAGSEAIATGLAERAEIPQESARELVAAVGMGRKAPADAADPDPDSLDFAAALQVREGLRRVIAEIQSSRGFYSARPDARPIGAVVLTGVMTSWPGVVETLTRELHLPVLPAGRDSWPVIDAVDVESERLDIAIGLVRGGDSQRPDLRPPRVTRPHEATGVSAQLAQIACGMVALLAAAVVYLVVVSNQISSGRVQLGELQSQLTTSEQRAAALKPYADFVAATTTRREAVATVAKARFKWDRTLTELAQVAPKGVWLTSVKGTLAPTTQIDADSAGATSALRGAQSAPALELSGCASADGKVPAYIDRLHLMSGVTDVGFSRSERLEKESNGGTVGAADCRGTDSKAAKFDLVTYFKALSVQLPATPAATVTTPAAGSATATATTAPGAMATTPATAATPTTATTTAGGTP